LFPRTFDKYEPFNVSVVMEKTDKIKPLLTADITLPTVSYPDNIVFTDLKYPKKTDVVFIGYQDGSSEIRDAIEANRIEISPAAHRVDLVKMSQEVGQKLPENLSTTLDQYDYYNVQMGLNIILGEGYRLPELRFTTHLFGDDNINANVVAYDIFPDDQIKRVKIIEGEISLGVSELFQFVAGSIGKAIANLLKLS
jgi:hypothetical protein